MDIQNAVLSKVIHDEDFHPLIDAKITGKFFPDDKHRKVFDFFLDFYSQFSKPPTADAVKKAYPNYSFPVYPEPMAYYLQQLQQDRKKVILLNTLKAAAKMVEQDEGLALGDDIEQVLQHGLGEAAHEISRGRDTDFFGNRDSILLRLEERAKDPGALRGISTGFPGLDTITGGLQKQQLITLVGLPKGGKSTVLACMVLNARRTGHRVLFMTFEMSNAEQEDRMLSLLSGVALTKIQRGTFCPPEYERIKQALILRQGMEGLTISSDMSAGMTLSGVRAKGLQYRPSLIVIDGMYLMEDETGHDQGSPQALTQLTRGSKRMAQTLFGDGVPVVVSTQAMPYRSKNGITMGSIGYTSSFAQDSDLIIGVEQDSVVKGTSKLNVIGIRSGENGGVIMRTDWDSGLVEEVPWEEYDKLKSQAQPLVGEEDASGLRKRWADGG